jgi:hypothetical protein
MPKLRQFWSGIVLLTALAALPALAQVDTGSISGTVSDASHAVVRAAAVKVVNEETGVSLAVLSNSEGRYVVPNLRPGRYSVNAKAPNFQTLNKTGVIVRVQDRIALDLELAVGATTTTVEVVADVPALQSESTSLGQVVEDKQINNIPLNGRNYIQLASLGAGTVPGSAGTGTSERNSFFANGVREIQNSYLLDGVDNKNKIVGFDSSAAQSIEPVIDSVQEFKVQTSTFSAEFGQAAGAVINVTTKSGTNNFHGGVFEYARNSALDADPYFQPALTPKPQFNQHQFGATLGGPVIRNRTFFFLGWQSSRTVDAAPQLAVVPTDAVKSGVFPKAVFDPSTTTQTASGAYTRTAYANNTVPVSQWDSSSKKVLALYPEPNNSGTNNYFSNQTERLAQDQEVARVDHRFGDKDNIFARASIVRSSNLLPGVLPPPTTTLTNANPGAHNIAVSETHVFSGTLVNEARVGYQMTKLWQTTADSKRLFEDYGINGTAYYPEVLGLPTFGVSGYTTIGTTGPGSLQTAATGSSNQPIDKEGRVLQFNDNLTWTKGKHTLKFGFDYSRVTLFAHVTLNARPGFSFNGVYTQNPQARSTTGAAFADFLLGQTSSATLGTRSDTESVQNIPQAYVQDDWKLTRKLTLNLGLRWEAPLPWYETANQYTDLIVEPGALYGTLLKASDASKYGYRRSFADPNYKNFAPRAGLAYRIDDHTVLRVAGGVFYGRDENLAVATRPTNNPPQYVSTTFTTDQIDTNLLLSVGFPASTLAKAINPTVNAFARHMPTPYVQEWNLTLQRELGHGYVLQTAYVGSGSRDLYFANNINQPTPAAGAIQARRPLTNYTSVNWYGPWVKASYNSLQTQIERRFSRGLGLLAAYTYSHALDNDNSGRQNGLNLAAERASSGFDVRQRFVTSAVYELPFGKGKPFLTQSSIASALAGGWSLSGIYSYQTGLPFTPTYTTDMSNTGTTERPNRIASGELSSSNRSISHWFNTAAFVAPAQYTYGNSGRNILRGPAPSNVDLSLSRVVPIRERAKLEIRAEAFNLFNTPQFGLPGSSIGTSSAGVISTQINPSRQLQGALKLSF